MSLKELRENRDNCYDKKKEFKKALEHSLSILDKYKKYMIANDWTTKGNVHFCLDQYENTIDCFNEMLAIVQNDVKTVNYLNMKAESIFRIQKEKEGFDIFFDDYNSR